MEIWKPIKGYEGIYEISSDGRVKSLTRVVAKNNGVQQKRKEIIKVPTFDTDGYLQVSLSKNGTTVKRALHRLVAEAFVDGYFDGAEVNHIDFDRTNNSASNLEWVSHCDNVGHSYVSGRYSECYRRKAVRMMLGAGDHVDFGSLIECAEYLKDHKIIKADDITSAAARVSMAARKHKDYCGIQFELI